jgi:hypothetical protein
VNASLAQLSVCIPWSEDVPFLLQMPGIGLVSAMTILSAIGDIARFPTPKHLVGYADLGAGIRSSGQTSRPGPITRSGRGELRTPPIQVAWAAARYSPYWRDRFSRLAPHKGAQNAITIIARKILVVIWHVLTHRTIDATQTPPKSNALFSSGPPITGSPLRRALAARNSSITRWFSLVFAYRLNRRGGLDNFILPRFSIAFVAWAVLVLVLAAARCLFTFPTWHLASLASLPLGLHKEKGDETLNFIAFLLPWNRLLPSTPNVDSTAQLMRVRTSWTRDWLFFSSD